MAASRLFPASEYVTKERTERTKRSQRLGNEFAEPSDREEVLTSSKNRDERHGSSHSCSSEGDGPKFGEFLLSKSSDSSSEEGFVGVELNDCYIKKEEGGGGGGGDGEFEARRRVSFRRTTRLGFRSELRAERNQQERQ